MHEWHQIHDFLYGFGMKENIPDNEIILEKHQPKENEYFIPWKIVNHKQSEKYVWLREAERWLGVTDIFTMTSEELYAIYDQLQPHIEKHLEWLRSQPVPKYDKITIPKINRGFPKL